MNIRLRSAQSRRDAVRRGLIGYLGAGSERNELADDLADDPVDDRSNPHAQFGAVAPAGEHLPAADEVTATAPPADPPA